MQEPAAATPLTQIGACANCGAIRAGPWCHLCGQHETMAHNSMRHLAIEAFEHLTQTDGKLLRTLRGVAFHPAALTRAYLAGRRMSQVSPLQLFLVMLVLFLLVGEYTINVEFVPVTPKTAASVPPRMRWVIPIGNFIHDHHAAWLGILRQSAEAFGVLTVPLAALLLWALYANRRLPLYDHLIFALHALTFQLFAIGVLSLLPDRLDALIYPGIALMALHLFLHMRGVYRGSVGGTLARMAALAVATPLAYLGLMLIWFTTAYLILR